MNKLIYSIIEKTYNNQWSKKYHWSSTENYIKKFKDKKAIEFYGHKTIQSILSSGYPIPDFVTHTAKHFTVTTNGKGEQIGFCYMLVGEMENKSIDLIQIEFEEINDNNFERFLEYES